MGLWLVDVFALDSLVYSCLLVRSSCVSGRFVVALIAMIGWWVSVRRRVFVLDTALSADAWCICRFLG